MHSQSHTCSTLLSEAKEETEQLVQDLYQLNSNLHKMQNNWHEYKTQIEEIFDNYMDIKGDVMAVIRNNKERLEKVVQDHPDITFEENQEPRVDDPLLSEEIDESDEIETNLRALELLSQKKKDVDAHKAKISSSQALLENYHETLQGKIERILNMTPEMFREYDEKEREKVLREVLLSEDDLKMQEKCTKLCEENVKEHERLRITYGFPEKPEENVVDEIENKVTECNKLCDKLNYSLH